MWVGKRDICAQTRGQTHRNIGSLTIPTRRMIAYVELNSAEHLDETLTFCPSRYDEWIDYERDSIRLGLELRRLNVLLNENPNDYQTAALETLMDHKLNLKFLGRFLVATLIHELSHAKAFTPTGRQLGRPKIFVFCAICANPTCAKEDIQCSGTGRQISTSGSFDCLYRVAKGTDGLGQNNPTPQGHLDAGKIHTDTSTGNCCCTDTSIKLQKKHLHYSRWISFFLHLLCSNLPFFIENAFHNCIPANQRKLSSQPCGRTRRHFGDLMKQGADTKTHPGKADIEGFVAEIERLPIYNAISALVL